MPYDINFKSSTEGVVLEVSDEQGVVKAGITFQHPLEFDSFLMNMFMHGHDAFMKAVQAMQAANEAKLKEVLPIETADEKPSIEPNAQ